MAKTQGKRTSGADMERAARTTPVMTLSDTDARIDMVKLRAYRLARVRAELKKAGLGAAVLFDPINIRYATGSRNHSAFIMHFPSRYVFIAVNGPVILFEGKDVAPMEGAELFQYRRQAQIVYQDPFTSLNPRMTVRRIIREPLDVHTIGAKEERDDRVVELMRRVGLDPKIADRYPHEFSGGQVKRVAIARAIAVGPKLLVADEAVSALDVSVRAQILNLLVELRERLGLAYLFVSHDLGVIRFVSHRVAVMYLGKLVEVASTGALFKQPLHPYTQALLAAIPAVGDGETSIFDDPTRLLEGELPNPIDLPRGCRFASRCPHRMARCDEAEPVLREAAPGHAVACYLYA